MEDGEDDLLGGGASYSGGHAVGEEITEFESSFPSVDTRNNVSTVSEKWASQDRELTRFGSKWPLEAR